MTKEFLPFDTVRDDALKLAHRMYKDGVVPDVIYCSLRGGAYMANVISEYYKLAVPDKKVMYAAVVAHSYSGNGEESGAAQAGGRVYVEGWSLPPESLRPSDTVMFVDDIFDSGRTVNALVKIFLEHGIPRKHIVVVVHDCKHFAYKPQLDILPDYWCRKIEVETPDDDVWIHYLSHELAGLTSEELEEHYYKDNPALRGVLGAIL